MWHSDVIATAAGIRIMLFVCQCRGGRTGLGLVGLSSSSLCDDYDQEQPDSVQAVSACQWFPDSPTIVTRNQPASSRSVAGRGLCFLRHRKRSHAHLIDSFSFKTAHYYSSRPRRWPFQSFYVGCFPRPNMFLSRLGLSVEGSPSTCDDLSC